MKALKIFVGIIVCLLALLIGVTWMKAYAKKPEVLIARLRGATAEEKEEVITQIHLVRGDFTTPALAEFAKLDNPAAFRAELVRILYQINHTTADSRIEEILQESLQDKQPEVRSASISCLALYGSDQARLAAIDCLEDPDVEVRRQAYLIFNADGRRAEGHLWTLMTEEQKSKLISYALVDRKDNPSEEIRFLADSIIGREVAILCDQSTEALQTSDIIKTRELLDLAITLDPESFRAKNSYVRHYLAIGDKETALSLADKYNLLLRIPLLTAAPQIDGDPTDEVWLEGCQATTPYLMTSLWTTLPATSKTMISIGHLNGTIYISVIAYEDDLSKLVVKNTTRDSEVYNDDCVEFSFDPALEERRDFRFSINPAGALYDRYGFDRRSNFTCEYAAKVFPESGYWACEFAVKAKDLNNNVITNESIWGMNVMRTQIAASQKSAITPTFGTMWFVVSPLAIFENAPALSELPPDEQSESLSSEPDSSATPQPGANRPRRPSSDNLMVPPRGGGGAGGGRRP
ncbi:MAG: HEAT repeat domain-containing protein [Planctomycetes bacterium]|nr:HEAT repeat domain-containing protein [Planctomycetota bacterium]